MLRNTKNIVQRILEDPCGLPEECAWIDYKDAYQSSLTRREKDKLGQDVTAFLNCIQTFGLDMREDVLPFIVIRKMKRTKTNTARCLLCLVFMDSKEDKFITPKCLYAI